MTKENWDILFGIVNILILVVTAYFMYRSLRSPVDAVKVGRKLNQEEQKDNAKRNLFLSLFSLRGNPVHHDFVRGLNQIEVVFEDVPKVIDAWRKHFASLGNKNQANRENNWQIERAALLSEMAVHLGYSNIPHGELLRDYYPEGHENQLLDDLAHRKASLDYFQMGAAVYQKMLENSYFQNDEKDKTQ